MNGRASAPAAGTVVNALATGRGCAFAIDLETTASVTLSPTGGVSGTVVDHPDTDPTLVERCVERVLDRFAGRATVEVEPAGGRIETQSDVPVASGLKSSSAAANAAVLATLDALGLSEDVDPLEACRIGVDAARDVGVTVTGAFDDAAASMLGGVVATDNDSDTVLSHAPLPTDWKAAIYTPPGRSFSADADLDACTAISPVAILAEEIALSGRYPEAMTVNGLAYCAALDQSTDPLLDAMPEAAGVSLSGTGPSFVAIGEPSALDAVVDRWDERPGRSRLVDLRNDGARIA